MICIIHDEVTDNNDVGIVLMIGTKYITKQNVNNGQTKPCQMTRLLNCFEQLIYLYRNGQDHKNEKLAKTKRMYIFEIVVV